MKLVVTAAFLAFVGFGVPSARCQSSSSDQMRANPAGILDVQAIDSNATAEQLEQHADELRAAKEYFDAGDYYRAALAKNPKSAVLYNKLGINELLSLRLRQAKSDFNRALKLNPQYAAAYNNLGVLDYSQRRFGKAIKEYKKAIKMQQDDAAYFSNLGTAYFSKKNWKEATEAYTQAVALDPNVFQTSSRTGIAGQIASPGDRAHFSYVLAELYATKGMNDRSLECLRRALEEGYKRVNDAYSDAAFTALRKDPRFAELMSKRPVVLPE